MWLKGLESVQELIQSGVYGVGRVGRETMPVCTWRSCSVRVQVFWVVLFWHVVESAGVQQETRLQLMHGGCMSWPSCTCSGACDHLIASGCQMLLHGCTTSQALHCKCSPAHPHALAALAGTKSEPKLTAPDTGTDTCFESCPAGCSKHTSDELT